MNLPQTKFTKPLKISNKRYCFVFVCHKGYIEIQSVFLAASLRRFLRCDYELIAVIPTFKDIIREPEDITLTLLKEMGVQTVRIANELMSEYPPIREYLVTNKLYCLKVPTQAEKLIFLDSDILLKKDFFDDPRFSLEFNAKMAGYPGTAPTAERWDMIFSAVGVEMPKLRMRVTHPEMKDKPPLYVPPYFNAGIIAIKADLANIFSDIWIDCFKKLDKSGIMNHRRFNQDQVSLALALQKMGLTYEIMEQDISEYFFHYHTTNVALTTPKSNKLLKSLISEYPLIKELIEIYPEWRDVLRPWYIMRLKRKIGSFVRNVTKSNKLLKSLISEYPLIKELSEKRLENRKLTKKACVLTNGFGMMTASVINISEKGLGLIINGKVPFKKSDKLTASLEAGASWYRVKWIKTFNDNSSKAGLEFYQSSFRS